MKFVYPILRNRFMGRGIAYGSDIGTKKSHAETRSRGEIDVAKERCMVPCAKSNQDLPVRR